MPAEHYIELVGKTIAVMEALRDHPNGSVLQQVAERTGQVKSSTHRILQSLKKHGYVDQESAGGMYRLGWRVATLMQGLSGNTGLQQFARPYLRELTESFKESSYLAVLRSGRGIFVEVQETRRDLRVVDPIGAEVHFHATAAGKAMAAFFPAERQDQLLRTLPLARLTSHTLTDPSRVRDEWAVTRQRGYAVNEGETIVGAFFAAAPILDANQQVCASLSVGVPQPRYSSEIGERLAVDLVESCRHISNTLQATGYVHDAG